MLNVLKKNVINIRGKKLSRKLLVFESDDWGSIRMPSIEIYNTLLNQKSIELNDVFSKYDALENSIDFVELFNVLSKHKDFKGNSPIITANTVVGNPNFNKINQSGFLEYHLETFLETYKSYPNSTDAFAIMQDGIKEKLYFPQFHAREHLNLPIWMELLQNNNKAFIDAFNLGCFSIDFNDSSNRRNNLMAAYDYNSIESYGIIRDGINEGLKIFESIFGFKSKTTIAPCYVWDDKIEKIFLENGVHYFQGSKFQNKPILHSNKFQKVFHYNGQKGSLGQTYFIRNGLFEPSLNKNLDWVDKCLESIEIAFKWNKPAIIGTHRLNFIGSIIPENREANLKLFDKLLTEILKKWPDVEFINSAELIDEYSNNIK